MSSIICQNCNKPLSLPADFFEPHVQQCRSCSRKSTTEVFPAYIASKTSAEAAGQSAPLVEEVNTCFYHPQKVSKAACDHCGRFMCALCEVEFKGGLFCPSCISSGIRKKRFKDVDRERTNYDGIAFMMAVVPIFLVWPTLIAAPATLFFVIRNWKKEGSILGRQRSKSVIAFFVALFTIVGWISLVLLIRSNV